MQTVLKNKDVDLSWYTPKEGNGVLHTDDPNALIVGFIVNDVREEWFFGLSRSFSISGRHWYAISQIQIGSTKIQRGKCWTAWQIDHSFSQVTQASMNIYVPLQRAEEPVFEPQYN